MMENETELDLEDLIAVEKVIGQSGLTDHADIIGDGIKEIKQLRELARALTKQNISQFEIQDRQAKRIQELEGKVEEYKKCHLDWPACPESHDD